MPIYEYKGQQYDITTEDPAEAKAKILGYLEKQPSVPEAALPVQAEPPTGLASFGPAVMRGGRGLASLMGDVLPAMGGKVLGADDYAKRQMQEAAAYGKETEKLYPSAVPSYTNIKDAGSALTYIVEAVGEAVPSLLPSLFTGGVAAVAGRGAVAAARVAAEKAAATSIAEGVTAEAAKEIAMKAGLNAAKREALKYEVGGALIGSAAQNVPDVYQGLYEKGYDNIPAALIFGGFNAALDAVLPINLLRTSKLSGIPENEIIGAWYKRAGKGAIEGMVSEGATESIQEMSSAAAEKFVDSNNNFFTPQNFERFINAGLKGGLGGAGISAATNVAFGRKEAEVPPPPLGTTPPTDSPIVGTTKVNVGGKESTKVNRQDGSVDIDGVQVTPPTGIAGLVPQAPEGIPTLVPPAPPVVQPIVEPVVQEGQAQDIEAMMREIEGSQSETTLPPVNVIEPIVVQPQGVPSATETPETQQAAPQEQQAPAAFVTWDTIQPGQDVTLYRGENKDNLKEGEWWTTDKSKAEKFGEVTEVTLPADIVGKHSVQGHGGPDEFVFPTPGSRPTDLAKKPEVTAPPAITGGPSTPKGPVAPVEKPVEVAPTPEPTATEEKPTNIDEVIRSYRDDPDVAAGVIADDLVGQTHLTAEVRQITKTYLTDGEDAGRTQFKESLQNPDSGFALLGLTQPEMDTYFKELDQYLTEKTNVFREPPAPTEGAALPKLPAGEYKPRDTFQHEGRTWQVTSVLHTGKGLEASTVFEKNKKSLTQRFEVVQPAETKTEPTEPTTTEGKPEVTGGPAAPTGGPAAPVKTKKKQVWYIVYKTGRQANGRVDNVDFDSEQEAKEYLNKKFTSPWQFKIKAKTIDVPVEKPEVTGGPSTPKPPKVNLTEEEKAKAEEEKTKAEEEKKKAAEEKAKAEEQKKKLEEFNKQPMKVAMEEGNADAVASLLYGNAVSADLLPVIFPEEGLLRIPVNMDKVSDIEAALTKYGFRITDRSVPATTDDPAYKGPERITISALYKPEKVSIQGGGAEFKGNRKGNVTAPRIPKDATDSQISKMLAEVSIDKLLDINSNVENSFGSMMYKEGIVSYVLPASDYLLKALKNFSGLYISEKTGSRQAIKIALSKGKEDEVQRLLQSYVEALQGLQKVFDGHSRVAELDLALRDKYLKDENAARGSDKYTQDGLGLRETLKANNLQVIFAKMYQLFSSDENSTDQTNRVVKKESEVPPELGNIVRRGMRDHRQGRDVDVQDFVNTFGLFPGGVDFGNWVNQSERAAHLNAIYDAMYDLADLSGISPKMLGLGQKLKMAIGAQGRGGRTAAHYIPNLNEINLTKTKGDGTLGHEWHHGLDFNLQKTENGKRLMEDTVSMLSETIDVDAAEENLRSILRNVSNSVENRNMPPKKAFFAAIANERWSTAPIYGNTRKETQFRRDARNLDKEEGRDPSYWSKPTEMLSRGFESMLFDASKGGSPYLVGPNRADGYISKKNGYGGTPYPAGSERPGLNEIFKQMLSQIDPDTLEVKTYKMETKIVKIEDLGYAVLDQYNLDSGNVGGLVWFKDQKEAEEAKAQRDGKERVLTPKAMQLSKVNERIISMAKRVDAIMEEMGLFKWPEIKNGSMAESMFYHMRQGWWPKNNRDLAEYGVKAYLQTPELLGFDPTKDKREIDAYKIADFEGDRVKLKQTQEDFEAAAVRYVSQVITDMRAQGSDTKAIYDYIVGLYQTQPTLDVQSVLSKTNNAYSTPLPIAFLAGALARVKSTTTVFDPTGGNGMLVVTANPQNVTTIELDPHRANNMELMQIGKVIPGNALEEIKNLRDQEVDVVLVNPPFDDLPSPQKVPSWDGREYKLSKLEHLIAAQSLRAMANNGRAVLIVGSHLKPGTITSADRVFLNWLYNNYNVTDHFEIAGNLYRKQGASFPLRVLVIAGRNQTDNAYPNDFVVDRITTFDELWSRYVQASNRSEEVVVGTGKKQPTTGGANKPAGGIPTGGTLEDGEPSGEIRTGEGVGIVEPVSAGGRGAGTPDAGGRGTTGAVRPGEQQPDTGDGERGGPGGIEAGGAEVSADSSGGPEPELGGLSDLDLDDIFNNLGKPEKPKGGPRAPPGPSTPKGEPRAPRGPSIKGPAAIPKELEGLGLEDLLGELDEALNGKAPEKKALKEEKATKVSEKQTKIQEAKQVATQLNMQGYLDLMQLEYIRNQQVKEAMGRIAQNAKNTSDDPASGLYSRKGDQDYANIEPIIQRVWTALGEKISDLTQRIKQVYNLLISKFGDAIKGHLRTFIDNLRSEGKRRPKNQTPVQSEPIDTESRVVYLGKSRFSSDGIYLPRAQSQYAYSALEKLEAQVGDIDEFVAKELGYASVEKMAKGLAGYQIDGLALAIQANKLGKGFIIGDDTGVGKGRAAAAMIVWAKKNGKIPIFVTVGKDLYSSMYEDLNNIGHGDINIGMTNTDSIIQKDIGNGKTKTVFQNEGKDGSNLISYIAKNGALPKGMDVLFTAYSQLNGGEGSPARQNAIASLVAAGKAVLIMDEAHNAAGVPTNPESMGQNAFFMSLLTGKNLLGKDKDAPEDWKPPSAVYLSATFAKRPDNMPLYIHTNLRYAANTPEDLTLLFGKGVKTDVLQQVSSEMLVESGSMLRRERSYEGVTMDFVTDNDNAPRDIREVDKVTTILRTLVNADRVLKEWTKSPQVQKSLVETLGPKGSMLGKQGPDAFTQAKGNGFTSVVHNYIGTLLLSAKTQKAVDMVVEKMNNGEKVVVGLQNTNGSALEDFVQKNGIKIGAEMPNFGWQTLIQRAIDSTRKITLKSATGDKKDDKKVEIPYSMMPQFVKDGYDNLKNMLKDFQSDLPVAPIDYMRAELQSKYVWTIDGKTQVGDTPPSGVKARHLVVKEVTGRSTGVDYSGDVPKYMALDKPERVSIISSFQNGEDSQNGPIDVLVINSAGATGISLHASVEAFDQRPRHMIVLQPHGDISVFTQLLGRIHRTGQVEWPSFTMLATGIPAERRILAMLRKKLSSLKSNTSGGSSSTKVEGVDFINRYGDVATSEYLNEHPEIKAFLDVLSYNNPEDAAGTDLAHKASGTAGLLASVDQQEFFDSIESSYLAAIELRNATGTNALERRVLPLNAEIIKENLIEEGLDNSNPFLTDVVMAQFNVDVIGSIPTKQNIQDDIAQALNGRTPQQVVEEIDTDLNTTFAEVRNQIILKQQALSEAIAKPEATEKDKTEFTRQKEALDIQFATLGERRTKTLDALRNTFAIGTGFETFEINNVPASAVVIGVKVDKTRIGKSKTGNPYSPSNFQVILKRNIPDGRVAPSLATLEGKNINRSEPTRRYSMDEWFALRSVTGGRTSRYIALGNILRAAQLFDENGGEVAKFTMQGQLEAVSGVVMPAKYKPVAISSQPIRLRSPNSAVQYVLAAWNQMLQTKYDKTQVESYKEVMDKLQPLMLPGLPNFAPFAEAQKNAYEINVAYGADRNWVLILDSYRPTNFKLTISGDAPKKFVTAPELKTLVPSMAKKRGGNYEMEGGRYITDPDKLIALIKFLHKSFPATVEADAAPLAREVMNVEFKDSESKKGMLSRGVAKGGQTVAAVQSQIVPIEGITIKVVQSSDNLPDTAAPSDVEGAWYSGNTVYLVADNLPNAQRVQEVLAHEAIGHAALEAMLGPEMMKELVKNVQALEKTSNIVKNIAAQVDRTQPGLSAERRAKEVVAMMAERGLQNGLIKRIVQAVRNWLRKAGFTIQFSDGDVLALLRNAEKYVGGRFDVKGEGLYSVNYRGAPATLATWQAADELKLTDTFIQKYVDKNIDTKRVIEAIKNAEGNIRDAWDPYLKEELFHGRTAKQTIDFLKNDFRPLLEDMDKRGVTLEDFNNYLHNRHAKVRNELIAERDPTKPDGGSGLFNSEVDEYMAALDETPDIKKSYEELATKIDSIVEETQNLLVSSGLEKQGTINNWRETFPFYVPLNREEDELDFVNSSSGMGQGFAVSGSFTKAAIGSFKTVKDIIGSIALQRERAIVRAEKARVGRALYALAIQNPNPTFWMPVNPDAIKNKTKLIQEMVDMGMSPADAESIIQEPKVGRIDEKTGLVKYQVIPSLRNSDNVLPVRINGEDRYVFFNPGNPNAKRMVESLKNLDAQKMDEVLNGVAEITRFIAAASTQYNPVFGAINFIRDVQSAAINLSSTPIADRKMQVVGDSAKAVRAIYRSLRGKEALTPAMQEWIDLFERFQKAGGQTGFRDQFSRGKGKETIVARELARLDRGNAKKAAYAVFDWLSDYNDAMENAVRLSAFKAALDSGMSEDQSASLAKNLTVNFNRKGANTQTIGALYAFFNASVQGTARLIQTLFTKDKEGKMSLSSVGKKIVAGGMLIGVMQTAILAMAGFGADDPPEWVKSKNLIIPTIDGGYLTIPMPLGFNIFPNVARIVSEYMLVQSGAMSGKRDLKKTIVYISSAVLGSVNPLGTSTFAQTLAPTAVDPFIGIAENKDAFGRPISKEDRALAPTPGYLRSRDSANGLFQGLAYGINYLTGGGEKGIGLVSPTADQLSYIAGQYTGGVGKLVVQTGEYAKAKVIGEELQTYQVPIAGKLYGDINTPAAISGKFYENIIEMSKHENIIKEMKGKGVSEYYKENPEARIWQRANYVENEIAKIKKEKKALKERNAPDEQIKRKDDQIKRVMEAFNKEVTKRQ